MSDQVEMQEVEIESMPVVELGGGDSVETVEELIDGQPMVAFHQISDQMHEEIVLQPHEEIVGDEHDVSADNDGLVYIDSIPVPAPEIDLSSSVMRVRKSPRKTTSSRAQQIVVTSPESLSEKKWEQKQFQIKTTEGEFSVTMWASGECQSASRCLCRLQCKAHIEVYILVNIKVKTPYILSDNTQ